VSKIEVARQAMREHPEMSSRAIAQMLGVSHMTVVRARNMADVPRDVPDVPAPALADGIYVVDAGKPYRIDCAPGDVFTVDDAGQLVPAPGLGAVPDGWALLAVRDPAPEPRTGRRVKVRAS